MGSAQKAERPAETPKKQGEYTEDDYREWPEDFRAELMEGVVYVYGQVYDVSRGFTADAAREWLEEQGMASPARTHQAILTELLGQFWSYLKGKTCKVYSAPYDVFLFPKKSHKRDKLTVQPDLTVVCDPDKDTEKGCVGAPSLVIEILSPSSRSHDTFYKYHQYQKAGVPEYWVIDPENRMVDVYLLSDGEYIRRAYGPEDTVPVTVLPGCVITLADVFGERL
jgi:Uma2 family endonuclease